MWKSWKPLASSPKQAWWAEYFNRFDFTLRYLPGGGEKNFLADALSRIPQYNCSKAEVIKPVVSSQQLAAKVTTQAQAKGKPSVDSDGTSALKAVLTDKWFQTHHNVCLIWDGLAWVGTKLCIPAGQRLKILGNCHEPKTVGHFGFVKTPYLLKRQFGWPSLKKGMEIYVASCSVCTSTRWWQGKNPGLLQAVAEPSASWREISMGFIL